MPPPLHPKLIARLAGMLAIGISLPWAVTSITEPIVQGTLGLAPAGTSTGVVLGTILHMIDQLTWTVIWDVVEACWANLLGLSFGVFWLFGGVWPITWFIKREKSHG